MTSLWAAFQFLTILPPIVRRPFTKKELGQSVGFYPLVGLALGGAILGLDAALRLALPTQVSAVLVLAAWAVLTRGLHLDGFLDTCDGLFGGFTPERRLEILRDSRVGAFGVIGGVLLLLGKYAALTTLQDRAAALLLAPILGRWAMSMAIVAFPYARENGLGRDIKDYTRWPQAVLAGCTALAVTWLFGQAPGLIALVGAGVIVIAAGLWVQRLIPGLTGDIYGAICELVELGVLVFFTIGLWPAH
ncbi:MAG: adenosylcobinamide-GDP ribazoletransferase [Anaerolineae bacterium]|nr:adenosylcobinamide-GDP ribazoletransferase [Anaerolineae bacterium]